MTKEEAKEAIKSNRINHPIMAEEDVQWVTQCSNGFVYYDDTGYVKADVFWKAREHPAWNEGWFIVGPMLNECDGRTIG